MGANYVNHIAEHVAPFIESLANCKIGVKIVSNLSNRFFKSKIKIPIDYVAKNDLSGLEVAQRIVDACNWANNDIYRATTHNKGIMNGVCAVALATGQDWRAIEADCHSYATNKEESYSLTKYYINNECLIGEIQLPLMIGVKGKPEKEKVNLMCRRCDQ
jgi:hydroxymethylglutaryl-CoA reductase